MEKIEKGCTTCENAYRCKSAFSKNAFYCNSYNHEKAIEIKTLRIKKMMTAKEFTNLIVSAIDFENISSFHFPTFNFWFAENATTAEQVEKSTSKFGVKLIPELGFKSNQFIYLFTDTYDGGGCGSMAEIFNDDADNSYPYHNIFKMLKDALIQDDEMLKEDSLVLVETDFETEE